MTLRESLEAAIDDDADGPANHQRYSDWLQEHGDPRGELIGLEHQLAAHPLGSHGAQLRARHRELWASHRSAWLGSLIEPERGRHLRLEWRYGFIRKARIGHRLELEPNPDVTLQRLLSHPSARFLRELDLSTCAERASVAQTLLEAPRTTLEKLTIGRYQVDLQPAWATLTHNSMPRLKRLEVRGRMGEMARLSLELPSLEELALNLLNLGPTQLDSVRLGHLPALTSLGLWLDASVSFEKLASWLAEAPPSLRVLTLENVTNTDALMPLLAKLPLIRHLRALHVTRSGLTFRGAKTLVSKASVFEHLERLVLRENRLTSKACESIQAALPAAMTSSQAANTAPEIFYPDRVDAAIRSAQFSGSGYTPKPEQALLLLESGLELVEATSHHELVADFLRALAKRLQELGRHREAVVRLQQRVEICEDLSQPTWFPWRELAAAWRMMGEQHHLREALAMAAASTEKAPTDLVIELAEAHLLLGDHRLAVDVLMALPTSERDFPQAHDVLGCALMAEGRLDEAELHFEANLKNQENTKKYTSMLNLSGLYELRGDHAKAKAMVDEAVTTAKATSVRAHADALATRGQLLLSRGRISEAAVALEASAPLAATLDNPALQGMVSVMLGTCALASDRPAEASREGHRALALLDRAGNREWQALALDVLASAETQPDKARVFRQQALELTQRTGDLRGRCIHLLGLGELSVRERELERAQPLIDEATRLAQQLAERHLMALSAMARGQLGYARANQEEAVAHFETARAEARAASDATLEASAALRVVAALGAQQPLEAAYERLQTLERVFENVGAHTHRQEAQLTRRWLEAPTLSDAQPAAYLAWLRRERLMIQAAAVPETPATPAAPLPASMAERLAAVKALIEQGKHYSGWTVLPLLREALEQDPAAYAESFIPYLKTLPLSDEPVFDWIKGLPINLRALPFVTHGIRWSSSRIKLENLKELADDSNLTSARSLELSHAQVNDKGLGILCASPHLRNLTQLSLRGNQLTDKGLEQLATAQIASLNHLDLSGNSKITLAGVTALLKSPVTAQLTELLFEYQHLGPELGETLAKWPRIAKLKVLRLQAVDLGDPGLAALLERLESVETLGVNYNGLTAKSIEALTGTPSTQHLRKLELSGNRLGRAGLLKLASWPRLGELTELNLHGVEADDICAEALAPRFACLDHLFLGRNHLTHRGATALVNSTLPQTLKYLDVSFNPLSDEGVGALASVTFPQLAILELTGVGMSDAGAARLASAKAHPRLQTLGAGANELTPTGEQLLRPLAHSVNLFKY